MGYQVYRVGKRWGGYGVSAICEYPNCNEEIDRGISFACGGEPFSEHGCDRYFCSKHLHYTYFNPETGKKCRHKNDCECETINVCERCMDNKPQFPYKPETKEWAEHVSTDESWEEWRKNNPEEAEELRNIYLPVLKKGRSFKNMNLF